MKPIPTSEETILKTIFLRTQLIKAGCYDEVVEVMNTRAKDAVDELASRIKDLYRTKGEMWVPLDIDNEVEQLKKELQ